MWRTAAVLACLAGTAHADVADDVARARGLRFKHPVPIETLAADAFAARLAAGDPGGDALALVRWGLAAPGDALAAPRLTAFYDATAKAVVVLAGAPDLALVPALDHALLDQVFGQAFDQALAAAAPADGDARRARRALEDGDALALAIEVALARAGTPPPWDDPELAAGLVAAAAAAVDPAAPFALREAERFSYRDGLAVVAALRRHHGWRAVDAMFRRPPASTEQILHADKYAAHEAPIAVIAELPPTLDGWTIAQSDVWGELGARTFLRAHGVADLAASEAAAGWGGDRELVCTREGRALGLWRSEWDTEAAAARAQAAIEVALDHAVAGATVERTGERTRWLALDGTVAWVERRGTGIVAAIGVPAYLAPGLATDAWTALVRRRDTARAR